MGEGSTPLTRARRHLEWARSQGLGRLIEEDRLNPWERARSAARRRLRRMRHPVEPGSAVPVLVMGVQRSGTNMVVRALGSSPDFEVFNENDRRAFKEFRLPATPVVRELVLRSGHRFVVFKPLCDSHRAAELLDGLATPAPPRLLWVHRSVEDRARSALAKFGDANLQALRRIAAGDLTIWQAGGISRENLELVRSFDCGAMTPQTAAALFWYIRNSLFFEGGLHTRADVRAVAYERLIEAPADGMRQICDFLGCEWDPRIAEGIGGRTPAARTPLAIDPLVLRHCEQLQARFDALAG